MTDDPYLATRSGFSIRGLPAVNRGEMTCTALPPFLWSGFEETGFRVVVGGEASKGGTECHPELVSIDGSFKAGPDLDKPGIIFLDSPQRGDAYREEFSLANAEDVTEILSTNYTFGRDSTLDELVPRALADALCHGDCVVAKNYSLLEPGIFARKYYAPGIGVFLEVEPDARVVSRLTSCNFDPRCATLPQP